MPCVSKSPPSDWMSANYLELNLRYFRERFSDKGLEAPNPSPNLRFSTEQSHSGVPFLVAEKDGPEKQYLQSRVNPKAEAEKAIREAVSFDESTTVVCVVGFELGYGTDFLRENLPSTTSILVWEPLKDAFLKALEMRPLQDVLQDKRVFIYVEESPVKAAQVFESFLNPVKVRNWSLMVGRGTYQLASNRVSEFYKELYSLTSARKLLFDTTLNHSHTFIKNAFQNLTHSEQAVTVESLRDLNKGRPTIVISAGPSLTKAIPTLREISPHCTIVAAGAAWKTLVNEGLRPNYVVLLDPFERTRSEFEGIEPDGETLIADFSGLPDVVANFQGPLAFYCSSPELHGVMNVITDRHWGHLEQGGSVAHIAFSFAKLLGGRPIVLIGQDLAFTGGLTHVGTHVDSQQVSGKFSPKHGPLHEVEAFGGEGTVLTSRSLDTFRLWFEFAAKDGVLNATGGGARIRGVPEIEFAELMDIVDGCVDASEPAPRLLPTYPTPSNSKSISTELKSIERRAQSAIKEIDRALKLLGRMQTASASAQNTMKLQFNELTRRLSNLGPGLSGILDYLARQHIFNTDRAYNTGHDAKGDAQIEINVVFYRGLRDACVTALDLLSSTRKRLPQVKKG